MFRLLPVLIILPGCQASGPSTSATSPAHRGIHDTGGEAWMFSGFLDNGRAWQCVFSHARFQPQASTRFLFYSLYDLSSGQRIFRSCVGAEFIPFLRRMVEPAAALMPGNERLQHLLNLLRKGQLPPIFNAIPPAEGIKPGPLALSYGPHSLREDGAEYTLTVRDPEFLFAARIRPRSDPVELDMSYSGEFGLDNAQGYMIPVLAVNGLLTQGGTVRAVQGEMFHEHFWGVAGAQNLGNVGVNSWSLQLADGEVIAVHQLRKIPSGEVFKTVLASNRRKATDIRMTPTEFWKSPWNVKYPIAWRLEADRLALEIRPYHSTCEVPMFSPQGVAWSGPVYTQPTGRGFQELTGYSMEQGPGWAGVWMSSPAPQPPPK